MGHADYAQNLTPSDPGTYSGNAYDPKRKLNYSIMVTAAKRCPYDARVLHGQADLQGRVLGCGQIVRSHRPDQLRDVIPPLIDPLPPAARIFGVRETRP